MNYKHQIITVMCDYGGTFLWQQSCGCGLSERCVGPNIVDCWGNLPVLWPEGWDIPIGLEKHFIQWQINFENHSLRDPKFNWNAHFRDEDALVDELQNVLGWKEYIVRPSSWESRLLNSYNL